MKYLFLFLATILASGCAHAQYQKCLNDGRLPLYCRWEYEAALEEEQRAARAFSKGMNDLAEQLRQQRGTRCTSQVIGSTIYTNCN